MDERRVNLSALKFLASFITAIQDLEIPFEYWQESDGTYGCMDEPFSLWGTGATLDAAVKDMVKTLREYAEDYACDMQMFSKYRPRDFVYVLKILTSSDEELLQCLRGKLSRSI